MLRAETLLTAAGTPRYVARGAQRPQAPLNLRLEPGPKECRAGGARHRSPRFLSQLRHTATAMRFDTSTRPTSRKRAARSVAPRPLATCRAKSSSVAWASPAPSSRSGQATSDASYRPRLTPFRLTSPAPPYRGGPALAAGRLLLDTVSRFVSPRRLARDRWRNRAVRALIGLRAGSPPDRA
jgi:hypothetical protein